MSLRHPLFHMRRQLLQHSQELRRAQRAVVAQHLAALDAFAEQAADKHRAYVAQVAADQQRLLTEAEGPPAMLAALLKQLH